MVDSVVALQALALMAMAVVVLAVTRRTTAVNPAVVVTTIAATLLSHFYLSFQVTHDCWLNLATLTAILAGLWFGRPLRDARTATAWGLFGGVTALVGPILGATWAVFTVVEGVRERSARRLLLATVVSIAVVTPWAVRNYRVFDRFIPVKSNLAFELHQSQILEPDGVLRSDRMPVHPYPFDNAERKEYKRLGEIAYLDGKMAEWEAAVAADPWSFVTKIGNRFLAATLRYVPLNAAQERQFYWGLWISRVTHALPFLAAVFLGVTAWRLPLLREQRPGLLVYVVYRTPYVLVSYYDRYAYPLMAMLLVSPVVWEHYFLLLPLPILILVRDTTGWRRSALAVSLVVMSVFRYHLVPLGMHLVGGGRRPLRELGLAPVGATVVVVTALLARAVRRAPNSRESVDRGYDVL